MKNISKYVVSSNMSAKEALSMLNDIDQKRLQTLFIVDANNILLGTLTDGDIRRALLKGTELSEKVVEFINRNFRFVQSDERQANKFEEFRNAGIEMIPVLDQKGTLIDLIELSGIGRAIPVDAVIMAGGKGKRLMPLTKDVPKPLLKIGDKPIIDYNIDRLAYFGVNNIVVSVNYLSEKIKTHFNDNPRDNVNISYVQEDGPLGTAGALGLIDSFENDTVLLMNSDLLTTINFDEFYRFFIDENAAMAIAAIPYNVSVPYAVLETDGQKIINLKEKPVYTYYSNAGIYLMKKEVAKLVNPNEKMDATDLIEKLLEMDEHVVTFHLLDYWLDIGRMEDYKKAQEDAKHLIFKK